MDRVPYIDQTGLYALEETLFDLNKKGLQVIIIGLQSQPEDMLRVNRYNSKSNSAKTAPRQYGKWFFVVKERTYQRQGLTLVLKQTFSYNNLK